MRIGVMAEADTDRSDRTRLPPAMLGMEASRWRRCLEAEAAAASIFLGNPKLVCVCCKRGNWSIENEREKKRERRGLCCVVLRLIAAMLVKFIVSSANSLMCHFFFCNNKVKSMQGFIHSSNKTGPIPIAFSYLKLWKWRTESIVFFNKKVEISL